MEKYLRRRIEADDVIIAEVKGKPVGYLRIEYLGLIAPYLGIVGVNEEYQLSFSTSPDEIRRIFISANTKNIRNPS